MLRVVKLAPFSLSTHVGECNVNQTYGSGLSRLISYHTKATIIQTNDVCP